MGRPDTYVLIRVASVSSVLNDFVFRRGATVQGQSMNDRLPDRLETANGFVSILFEDAVRPIWVHHVCGNGPLPGHAHG